MKIVVAQISEDEGLSIRHQYPEGQPALLGGAGQLVGHCEVNVRATRAVDKVELIGNIDAVVGFECDRCLTPWSIPLEQSFDLLFVPPLGTQDEKELAADDLSVGFYQGEVIDLDDLVREQVE